MSDHTESISQDEIVDSRWVTACLLNEYQRFACLGEEALEGLEVARDLYETTLASDAVQTENIEARTGMQHLLTHDQIRRELLLDTVSPVRFKKKFGLFEVCMFGSIGGNLLAAAPTPLGGRALAYAFAAYNYADKKEEYQRDLFAGILDEYSPDFDTASLSFQEIIRARMDHEIEYIGEILQPELEARRKRVFGRALVVGAGLFAVKALL